VAATKADAAYELLRRAIVTGAVKSGQPLDERVLAEDIGYGRTPIREALKRLASEQFITWHPRTPPVVRDMSISGLYRLREARSAMEETAIRLSCQRISHQQLEELQQLVDQLRRALLAERAYEAVELDYAVHNAIAAGSDNVHLVDAVARINSGSLRLWYRNYCTLGRLAGQTDKHSDFVEALVMQDEEMCAKAMRVHISESFETSLRLAQL